jgi:Kef-type K+ transport system membrane component KefB
MLDHRTSMRYKPSMRIRPPRALLVPMAIATLAATLLTRRAQASSAPGEVDMLPLLAALALVIVVGRLGGALFERLGQPAVLGELLAGVLVGNLGLIGIHALDALRSETGLAILAQIGVLLLLFEVGLETDVARMLAVGASSLAVATLGVVTPMALGYLVSSYFFPSHPALAHVFIGATLTATSVGITARVLSELRRSDSAEGRIILGAAVIDDVLGLLVLAAVSGVIEAANAGRSFDATSVAWIAGKAVIFLVAAIVLGRWLSRGAFMVAARIGGRRVLLSVALAFCFGLAWLAGVMGLAPIVGAFAAGLVLEESHYRALRDRDSHIPTLQGLLDPLSVFLVPVFFVLMGLRVDLASFTQPGVAVFAIVLTLAAALGKQACALGVLVKGCDRVAVGLGMIPRGEVGLIFAGIGASLRLGGEPVIDPAAYAAVVVMVALTTLVTPALLARRLRQPSAA